MKIGILTFHRAANYGAVLQCYALQQFLKELGHNVLILDYRQPYIEDFYRRFDFRMLVANLLSGAYKGLLSNMRKRNTTLCQYERFRKSYLELDIRKFSSSKKIPTEYDIYVIGSDQVWNPDMTGGKVDDIYWGNFRSIVNGKVASYAASTTVKALVKIGDKDLKELLNNFDSCSIREADYYNLVQESTNKNVFVNVDPTLLISQKKWEEIAQNSKCADLQDYILLYSVRAHPVNRTILDQKATELNKKTGLPIIKISTDKMYSPEDFVCLFKNASYVITSSFHGTAFSIIFRRTFWSFMYNDGSDNRYVELLNKLGLSSRLVSIDYKFDDLHIDYSHVDRNIAKLKQDAINYFSQL